MRHLKKIIFLFENLEELKFAEFHSHKNNVLNAVRKFFKISSIGWHEVISTRTSRKPANKNKIHKYRKMQNAKENGLLFGPYIPIYELDKILNAEPKTLQISKMESLALQFRYLRES